MVLAFSPKKCFYLKLVKGLQPAGIPQFKLNELTDTLLKKEFQFHFFPKSQILFLKLTKDMFLMK